MCAVTPSESRQQAFIRWLTHVLDHAERVRGIGTKEIAHRAGVGWSTVYRWLRGETLPDPGQLEKLCDELSVPTQTPLLLLWPGKTHTQTAGPSPEDADLALLVDRLHDPKVPEVEKYHIRETLRSLAARPPAPAPDAARRRRRAS